MKINILKTFVFFVIAALLVSCDKETSPVLSSTSENGEIQVNVQGSRYLSTDPYKVSVVALTKYDTLAVEIEAMSESISEETVSFEWMNANKCFVHITQRDGTVQTVPITIMD